MSKIACILLAAGASSRMKNQVKQLLPWRGATLLEHAIATAVASKVNDVFVILGANFEKIYAQLTLEKYQIIENKDWEQGIGSSIAKAIMEITKLPESYDAVLIALADQPLIDTAYYDEMISIFNKGDTDVITTSYLNKKGVPAIFRKTYFKDLRLLHNDIGAKQIIANASVETINCNGKEADIDTWEDYQRLLNK
tara:strand:+ start:256459 stop:257046 length:588 start_codon:yes stop_codon:yes gene_type:complete